MIGLLISTPLKNMNDQTTICASSQQVSCQLDGDTVVLNLKNSTYYELNPVAARIWELIQEPVAVGRIRQTIVDEYDVTVDRADQDLNRLLDDLNRHKLLDIRDGKSADETAPAL